MNGKEEGRWAWRLWSWMVLWAAVAAADSAETMNATFSSVVIHRVSPSVHSAQVDKSGMAVLRLGVALDIRVSGLGEALDVMLALDCSNVSTAAVCDGKEPAPVCSGGGASSDVFHRRSFSLLFPTSTAEGVYSLCVLRSRAGGLCWEDGGAGNAVDVRLEWGVWIPGAYGVWVEVLLILVCLGLSGLFSGLNIGLMTIDLTELKTLAELPTKEGQYARTIRPVRERANWLLCSILIGNCLVNCALTMLMDNVMGTTLESYPEGGRIVISVVIPTFLIVIFGEIIPQSICTKMGLMIGARTIWFTYAVMGATVFISKPLSMILDLVLGQELARSYTHSSIIHLLEKAKEEQQDRKKGDEDEGLDEMDIAQGALVMADKVVRDVFTKMDDVFALSQDDVLGPASVARIKQTGYSRIPVFKPPDKDNIVGFVHVRDFLFVAPLAGKLDKLILPSPRPMRYALTAMPLCTLLSEFRDGFHMATVIDTGASAATIGLVTMEDILELICRARIADEFDVDEGRGKNVGRCPERPSPEKKEGHVCLQRGSVDAVLTMVQSTPAFTPFHSDVLSLSVLRGLVARCLRQTCISSPRLIMRSGQPATQFLLIWEGEPRPELGRHYGLPCLLRALQLVRSGARDMAPDHVVRAAAFTPDSDLVLAPGDFTLLQVGVRDWLDAFRCSLYEREANLVSTAPSLTQRSSISPTH